MPARVVCPTLSTMSAELLSGRSRVEGRVDEERYERLLAVDPVLLRRPDVLPAGDLGIRNAVRTGWRWPDPPRIEDVRRLGERWSPYRTYAAALLWASLQGDP